MDHAQDVLAVVFNEVGPIALGRLGEFAMNAVALVEKRPKAVEDRPRLHAEQVLLVLIADCGLHQEILQSRLAPLARPQAGFRVKLRPVVLEPLCGVGYVIKVAHADDHYDIPRGDPQYRAKHVVV